MWLHCSVIFMFEKGTFHLLWATLFFSICHAGTHMLKIPESLSYFSKTLVEVWICCFQIYTSPCFFPSPHPRLTLPLLHSWNKKQNIVQFPIVMTAWKHFISLVVLSSVCQLERGVICKSHQSDISSLSDACHIPARFNLIVSKVHKEIWVAGLLL